MASSRSSRIETFCGTLLVLILAALPLYSGVDALITGELYGTGTPRNKWHHTGVQARIEGVFLIAVGATILLLPFVDVLRSRLLRVLLVADALLFVAAAFLYKLL